MGQDGPHVLRARVGGRICLPVYPALRHFPPLMKPLALLCHPRGEDWLVTMDSVKEIGV